MSGFIKSVHDANMEIYIWTIDDPGEAAMLMKSGIDGITTNRPGWIRKELDKTFPCNTFTIGNRLYPGKLYL